ncbi:hypothetical protein C1752_12239 [Acaryochloris thomasi RCC1774]|uniref:Uncharacterized protein n=1 Tax=Acaryochloris thomasi RCC1774 TaxID=1764569 RepID=A0A2W1J8I7_9CYAN|nr:hypothetical protein [Acaryochloris thomasi]PZD70456.1 hypothetical protein C1752_12239 [Acaryochloris thomasi RCC1774]
MFPRFIGLLLIFPATFISGAVIAETQSNDEFLANYPPGNTITQRMRDYRSFTCGKYCENYPQGISEVRFRDWQR